MRPLVTMFAFETIQKLQGSQAQRQNLLPEGKFETIQKLQGSQAGSSTLARPWCLRPYRNYKVLKHKRFVGVNHRGLRPYRNYKVLKR